MKPHNPSNEETMFEAWLKEAVTAGLVSHYHCQPESIPLTPRQVVEVDVELKTKTVIKDRFLCAAHVYTADFRVDLTARGQGLLRGVFQKSALLGFPDGVQLVDTKGGFMDRGTGQEFSINQKLVFAKYGVWVAKVVPWMSQIDRKGNPKRTDKRTGLAKAVPCWFMDTWCPESLAYTSRGKVSAMGAACRTCGEFMESCRVKG